MGIALRSQAKNYRALNALRALGRIGILTARGQVSHRDSAVYLPETLDSPPLQPGSPPGIGIQKRDLHCAACTGHRAIPQRFKIAALLSHHLMR